MTDDHFVARWTGTLSFAPGEYGFVATTDDGVRLIVDGVTVVDQWVDQGATSHGAAVVLDGGPHTIVMEYYEHGGDAVAQLSWTQLGDLPQPPDYTAEYWNTPGAGGSPAFPTGPPDLVRADPAIGYDWGGGAPAPEIAEDHFVARWTRSDVLAAGLYRFSGASDDGVRVFVDNVPVVDQWVNQNAPYTGDIVLLGGPHVIRVEYYENGGGALMTFGYERIGDVVPPAGYSAEYFANPTLAGAPVLTRTDAAVDFDWGLGAPAPGVPEDGFSVRWTRSVVLAAGYYEFSTTSDDGVRLYVDGVRVIDKWHDQGPTTYTGTRLLDEGTHTIVLEYYENSSGALARMVYAPTDDPPPPEVPYQARYFDNRFLGGDPVLTRTDAEIAFDWAGGSPGAPVPADDFSAVWTRTAVYDAGPYRFSATSDDGIRVLLDNVVVIDGWTDHGPTTFTADVGVPAGQHTVVVEYYEAGGGAMAQFTVVPL